MKQDKERDRFEAYADKHGHIILYKMDKAFIDNHRKVTDNRLDSVKGARELCDFWCKEWDYHDDWAEFKERCYEENDKFTIEMIELFAMLVARDYKEFGEMIKSVGKKKKVKK